MERSQSDMTKIIIFFSLITFFLLSGTFAYAARDAATAQWCQDNGYTCTSIDVSFNDVADWPTDEGVKVSCKGGVFGDEGAPNPCCEGDYNKEIKPGESVSLNNCNCRFANPDGSGCFYIEDVPEKVKEICGDVNSSGGYCLNQNGNASSPALLSAICQAPPEEVACVSCQYSETCIKDGKAGTKVCDGGVEEDGVCKFNSACTNCGECQVPEESSSPSESQSPSESPSETESPNPSESSSTGPSESVSPSPSGSKSPSSSPSGSRSPSPSGSATPPGKSPSPTPPLLNEAMCKCDGIQATPIFPGQPVEVTSFAKVEGKDTSLAKISTISFTVTKDNTIIQKSNPISASVIESTSNKLRYNAKWKFNFPQNIDTNATYRIFSNLKCEKKSQAQALNGAVLAAQTSSNPLQNLWYFFGSLFGSGQPTTTTPTSSPPVSFTPPSPQGDLEQLKLGVLKPAQVINEKDTCRFLILKFPN